MVSRMAVVGEIQDGMVIVRTVGDLLYLDSIPYHTLKVRFRTAS